MLSFQKIPKTYPELLAMHAPRPLQSEGDMDELETIAMAMAGYQLNKDQEDYLELLAILIDDYETKKKDEIKRGNTLGDALGADAAGM